MSDSTSISTSPEDKENEKPGQETTTTTTKETEQVQEQQQNDQEEQDKDEDDLVSAFNKGLEAIKRSDFESAVAQLGRVAANGDKVSSEVLNKAKTRLVYALLQTGRDEEADKVMESPTDTNGGGPPQIPTEETEVIVNGNGSDTSIKNSRFELRPVPNSEEGAATKESTKKKLRKERRSEERKKDRRERRNKNRASQSEDGVNCSYCSITLNNQQEFLQHCRGEKHQQAIFSDHGREWKHRPPPRGIGSESYSLCLQFARESRCRFEGQCVEAHSEDELKEWRERFEYRKAKAQEASRLCGRTFVEIVLDKLAAVEYRHDRIFQQNIVGIACSNSGQLDVQASKKGASSGLSWVFEVKAGSHLLQDVGLMNDSNRRHFSLDYIKHVEEGSGVKSIRTFNANGSSDKSASNIQEWSHPCLPRYRSSAKATMTYRVKLTFKADIFGTFRQSIVFHFSGLEQYLRRNLCVDVVSMPDDEEEEENAEESARKFRDRIIKQPDRWDENNSTIVDFDEPVTRLDDSDRDLLTLYPHPQPQSFRLSKDTEEGKEALNRGNYRSRMHDLLYAEEMGQCDKLRTFNVVTRLQLTANYLLTTATNSSTAKYARPGELFGKMTLGQDLSEDTSAGRLILTNCSMLMLSRPNREHQGRKDKRNKATKTNNQKRVAYVSTIEDTGKNTLYLRLSSKMVDAFSLTVDGELEAEVQFQLNRVPLCEMHLAVDRLPDLDLIHPDVARRTKIPWSPARQWNPETEMSLNPKQREAVVAITSDHEGPLPPILIIGPYGTGKTFTMGQAVKLLLGQRGSRVLVCTHSNSAADLYVRDYLHPYILENPNVKLRRVYYRNRWVQTVNQTVQKYCFIHETETARVFRDPSKEDLADCDVVVATLATSRRLGDVGLPRGHFSHILIDEAAQALECEALMPLALASTSTRIVLAGDYMQLSPEVFSEFARERRFNKSLLERLYDLYPEQYPCKILLCENYRSHEAIISYTSDLFYNRKLIASGKQSRHGIWHPLTVFTARGEDVQATNSTSFYNNAEVYEVVDRVAELQRTWPKAWRMRDDTSIGVVTPYYDQVQRIRSELRKRRLFGVSVERVLNVQGKQFRAIFLSTVRTRKTCAAQEERTEEGEADFGFLSSARLLNTAITRAQSLVAVVGDPVALCSVGRCRRLWERLVESASLNNSLFGLTWQELRVMLDGVELKKSYVLNPLAQEFVPKLAAAARRFQKEPFHIPPPPPPQTTVGHGNIQQQQQLQQGLRQQQQHLAMNQQQPPAGMPPPPPPPQPHPNMFPPGVPPQLAAMAAAAQQQQQQQHPPFHPQMGFFMNQPHLAGGPPAIPPMNAVAAAAAAAAVLRPGFINPYTTIPPYPGGGGGQAAAAAAQQIINKINPHWNAALAAAGVAPPPPNNPSPSPKLPSGYPPYLYPPKQQTLQPPMSHLRHANSTPSLLQRPMSPGVRKSGSSSSFQFGNQQQQQQAFQSPPPAAPPPQIRPPNPQFAGTRYQRVSNEETTPPLSGQATAESAFEELINLNSSTNAAAATTNSSSNNNADYQLLSERVHLPQQQQQLNSSSSALRKILKLLPSGDEELSALMTNQQAQQFWFNHLTVSNPLSGDAEAFLHFIVRLQKHPHLLKDVQTLRKNGQQQQQPQQQQQQQQQQQPRNEGVYLAEDLEALFLDKKEEKKKDDFANVLRQNPFLTELLGESVDEVLGKDTEEEEERGAGGLPLFLRGGSNQTPASTSTALTMPSLLNNQESTNSNPLPTLPSFSSINREQIKEEEEEVPAAVGDGGAAATLTYANVLRNPQRQQQQQQQQQQESSLVNSLISGDGDALTKIRSLGTQANREDRSYFYW